MQHYDNLQIGMDLKNTRPAMTPEVAGFPPATELPTVLSVQAAGGGTSSISEVGRVTPCAPSPVPASLQVACSSVPTPASQPSILDPQPAFPRAPGETPRAFTAFITYFHLGHNRSLQAVADQLDETLPTVKRWSSRYAWNGRLQEFNAGLLQQQARDEFTRQRQQAADWAHRLQRFREQEWDAAQKLLAAAQCFLESFGEEELGRMNLAQVSRALKVSSTIGRLALGGAELSETAEPALAPAQLQLLESLHRVYGQPGSVPGAEATPVTSKPQSQS